MVKIKVVIPNSGMDRATLNSREKMLESVLAPKVKVSVDCISDGPKAIASFSDESYAGPYVIKAAREAEANGYDAFVVYCFSDPSVFSCREIVSIPIIGPGEASIVMAAQMARKFSVITTEERNIPRIRMHVESIEIGRARLQSIIPLGIEVLELRENRDKTLEALLKAGRIAVEKDEAELLILGCLGMAEYGDKVKKELGVPILDPAFISVKMAEMMVALKISHSKKMYQQFY